MFHWFMEVMRSATRRRGRAADGVRQMEGAGVAARWCAVEPLEERVLLSAVAAAQPVTVVSSPNDLTTIRNPVQAEIGEGLNLVQGDLVPGAHVQTFEVALDTHMRVRMNVPGAGADLQVRLIQDQNGNELLNSGEVVAASTQNYQNQAIPALLLDPGTYHLQVVSAVAQQSNPYTVRVNVVESPYVPSTDTQVEHEELDVAVSAKLPQFPIFNATRHTNVPADIHELGFSDMQVLGPGKLIKEFGKLYPTRSAWVRAGRPDVPDDRIRNAVRDLDPDLLLVLDVESWKLFGVSEREANYAMDRFIDIVNVIRDERPDLTLGYFGRLPQFTYVRASRGPGDEMYEEVIDRINLTKRLANKVDVIFPVIYRSPRFTEAQHIAYVQAQLKEARRYGKPVIAAMWTHYRPIWEDGERIPGRMLTARELRTDLDLVYQYADGAYIWNARETPWNSDVRWVRVIDQFVGEMAAELEG